jgi:hypothetical protein
MVCTCGCSVPAAPRSSKVTKLLEDGTLIVKGQEVGKVDPTATKEGQLVVPVSPCYRSIVH